MTRPGGEVRKGGKGRIMSFFGTRFIGAQAMVDIHGCKPELQRAVGEQMQECSGVCSSGEGDDNMCVRQEVAVSLHNMKESVGIHDYFMKASNFRV